jgi:hypothetical protein
VFSPDLPDDRRRHVDRVLDDDFLSRLPTLDDDDLLEIRNMLSDTEVGISGERRSVQRVVDVLHQELVRRYKEDAADLTVI